MFEGPESLRVPGERRSLWLCVIAAPIVIAFIQIVFPAVSISEFVLLIAAGLVFVSISRGRLLGSSVRVDARQFPEIAELVESLSRRLGVTPPQVFVRDDPFVPLVSVGVGEPYALVISSQYYEHLRRDELRFLLARELAHIAAGHTRLTSLLNASGRENAVVALVFGAWLRKTEYTADRVGMLLCDDPHDALGAISISTFHAIGRRVDMAVLAEQHRELERDPALRVGEWSIAAPYATNRLQALGTFGTTPLAAAWRARLDAADEAAVAVPEHKDVERAQCASTGRRLLAAVIDLSVISAALQTPAVVSVSRDLHHETNTHVAEMILQHLAVVQMGVHSALVFFVFYVYSAVLVALAGQTLGMTVMDARVVTTSFARPGILQSFWRYALAFMSSITSLALVGLFMRIQPHDRLSRTRLVGARRPT